MINLSFVKSILKITDTNSDALIDSLIYPCVAEALKYSNNTFPNTSVTYSGYITIEQVSTDFYIKSAASDAFVNYAQEGYITVKEADLQSMIYQYQKSGNDLKIIKPTELTYYEGYAIISPITIIEDFAIAVALLIGWYLNQKGVYELTESLPGGYSVSYKHKSVLLYDLFNQYRIP